MKQYKNFLVDDDLNIYSSRTKKKLKPHIGSDGYMQVMMRDETQKSIHERVHVIYAHLFIPNPNNYKYVNHIDSDKTNNKLSNLEWCTNSENVRHGWHSGNRTHKNNTKVAVFQNGALVNTYKSIRSLAKDLSLDRHKVARILKGELENKYSYTFEYIESPTTIERVLAA